MKNQPTKLLFLPGASGNIAFWQPVMDLLEHSAQRYHLAWPGFGQTPADPDVNSIDDLVARVVHDIDQPCALIAQSMGGVVAIRAALEKPEMVTHLVLAATSGGIDMRGLGAQDWRSSFQAAHPTYPRWFADDEVDLTDRLKLIAIPALLIFGDADSISPVEVGTRLATALPFSVLRVIAGGDHDVANLRAPRIASLIDTHLATTEKGCPCR